MITYRTDELFSTTDITKNFSSIAAKLSKHEIEKVGILKNNKLDFVLLRSEDLDRLIARESEKRTFEQNREYVAKELEKIHTKGAKFYTFEEIDEKLESIIKSYEN